MNKKVLVTGGAGFIGSFLCEKLLAMEKKVIVLDNLSTGKKENIAHLVGKKNSGLEFVKGDVCDKKTLQPLAKKCSQIYHLAAAVGVKLIVEKPVHTIETNIRGTEAVLECAQKYNCKVLITSTSEVYGKSEKVPFHEDDDTVLGSTRFARWSYACSKAIDEFLAFAYHDQYGLETVIVRLFNTIGPRQVGQYGMVVPRFVERALKNETLEIYGDGSQSRCFTYVEDVCRAITALMDAADAAGKVYNVGSTEEVSIDKLADMIIQKTKSKSKKIYVPYKKAYGKDFDDMKRRLPSIERLKKETGFKQRFTLSQTLDIIIEEAKKQMQIK